MTNLRMSDDMLMAYVDRELDDADARAVEDAARADAGIAGRLDNLRRLRSDVRDAFAGLADEPVPPRLAERVREMVEAFGGSDRTGSSRIVPFALKRPFRRVQPHVWALAASVAVVAMGLGAWLAVERSPVAEAEVLALGRVASSEVAAALSTLPSGERQALAGEGASIGMVASFRDGQGRLCREFEIFERTGRALGVACRPAAGWSVGFAMAAGGDGGDYAPASTLETLDAYLQSLKAGEPLSPADEKAALSAR